MDSTACIVLAAATLLNAEQGQPLRHGYVGNSALPGRMLLLAGGDRPARASGQCTYSCGDVLIEAEPCPDGSCPEFDCNTRTPVCPVR
jgi:hypothetical protein